MALLNDLHCNCIICILPAMVGGDLNVPKADKNFPILDCQSLAQSIAISCNLLQSYSQQDIKWPARQISHIFTASVQPIYCGSLAKICRSSHSIPKFCCRMSCWRIPKKLLNSINSKNSLIFTLFPIYYH